MSRAGTLLATAAGVAVAAAVSLLASVAWALGAGLAVVALGSRVAPERVEPLVAAIWATVGLGLLTYVPVVPPLYPPAIGTGLLASAVFVLLGVELGVRAGEIVAAKGVQNTDYGRSWEFPTAVLAIALLSWRVGTGGRALLVGLVGLIVGAHAAVVHLGGSPAQQAATLVPVALVYVAALAAASEDEYVADGTEHSPLRTAGIVGGEYTLEADEPETGPGEPAADVAAGADGSAAATAASADGAREQPGQSDGDAPAAAPPETPGSRETVPTPEQRPATDAGTEAAAAGAADASDAAARDDAAEGSADDGWSWPDEDDVVKVVDDSGPQPGESAPGAAGTREAGAVQQEAGTEATHGADAADDVALRSDDAPGEVCQNCGEETDDCQPRVVLTDPYLRVALCGACHDARADAVRPLAECRQRALPVDVAAAGCCQVCGATGGLEAHPVVPPEADGHRHPNNVLALCADCHERVEAHQAAE